MQQESIGEGRAIDNAVLRDRLVVLQAEVTAMKCNGMRILSNSLKGEPGGMAKLIVKLPSCEVAHQLSPLATDAMGEMGILYHRSPAEREDRKSVVEGKSVSVHVDLGGRRVMK